MRSQEIHALPENEGAFRQNQRSRLTAEQAHATNSKASDDLRVAHGLTFVLLMACGLLAPALRVWPWVWLGPFIAYIVLVSCVRPLRHSMVWARVGKISAASFAATLGIIALTISTLLLFQMIAQPDVSSYHAKFPLNSIGGVVTAGLVFTTVNATLEELVFRGVLFDALQSQWSAAVTLIATSLLFGLGHLRGYPPGLLGVGLATLFGFAMGVLRLWTGGLSLPILAHMAADATIYSILVHSRTQ